MAIRVKDLAEKWLKDCGDRPAVLDAVAKEEFVEVFPDDVKVWVIERKPRTTQEAGRLAEDYCQARKAELWTPAAKSSTRRGLPHTRGCYSCGQLGHQAKDCGKKVSSSLKSEDVGKVVKKVKRDEKPLTCYNCGGKGHTSRQCPSEAFLGTIRRSDCFRGGKITILL